MTGEVCDFVQARAKAGGTEEIVEILERYLVEAQEGKLNGIVVGISRYSEVIGTAFFFGADSGHKLVAVSSILHHRVLEYVEAASGGA